MITASIYMTPMYMIILKQRQIQIGRTCTPVWWVDDANGGKLWISTCQMRWASQMRCGLEQVGRLTARQRFVAYQPTLLKSTYFTNIHFCSHRPIFGDINQFWSHQPILNLISIYFQSRLVASTYFKNTSAHGCSTVGAMNLWDWDGMGWDGLGLDISG